ncbi:hypothetical protein Hanom_Chr07g00658781 [Helianthus anomalus]
MFFLFVKTILFMLRVFKVIMTIFFHYYIIFLLCMNLTRPEPSNRPVFFYIRTYDIGTFSKVNHLKKILRSVTVNMRRCGTSRFHTPYSLDVKYKTFNCNCYEIMSRCISRVTCHPFTPRCYNASQVVADIHSLSSKTL